MYLLIPHGARGRAFPDAESDIDRCSGDLIAAAIACNCLVRNCLLGLCMYSN